MKGGDVLLFHRPLTVANFRKDPKGTAMCALIQLATKSRFNHAAILIDPKHYAEATAQGVMTSVVGSSSDETTWISVPFDDEEDRLTAVAWAVARSGEAYGYLNAILCGLNELLVGLGLVIKRTDAIICSELVAEALERAGLDFGKDSSLVSPGDLAEHFGVAR